MSGSSFEELFGSFTIVDPATPKVPRATSGAGVATAAATDDPRVLETHFVAFGTDQESFDSEGKQKISIIDQKKKRKKKTDEKQSSQNSKRRNFTLSRSILENSN